MKNIGFIGTGIMGKSMVENLMKAGYCVSIFTRTKEKAEDIINKGAIWKESVAECVKDADAVITIVGFPKDVEEVYFGEKGILANAKKGSYIIDMTTNSPKLAEKIYQEGTKKGLHVLDAPVTGGDIGSKNGTLTIMVGGEEEDFKACYEIFQAMGENIVYEGKAGSGQHTKMANQIVIAGTLTAVCEAMVYAKNVGLDVKQMMDTIKTGVAGSKQLEVVAPRILDNNFEPGFFIKHFIKDMGLAKEEAVERGIHLEVLEKVLDMYQTLEEDGKGELGTQAIIQYYK